VVTRSASTDDAVAAMERYGVDWVGIREGDRLLGWAWHDEVHARGPSGVVPREFQVRLGCHDSLRDALDTVITSHTRVAPVFDGDRFVGMLRAETISREVTQ